MRPMHGSDVTVDGVADDTNPLTACYNRAVPPVDRAQMSGACDICPQNHGSPKIPLVSSGPFTLDPGGGGLFRGGFPRFWRSNSSAPVTPPAAYPAML